jgi:glycerol-3-phosphate acyltransferase PlsY
VTILLTALGSYLVGGIPFSYIAGRAAKGIDLREHGSGNLGASNTYRILGAKIALAVLVLDIAKGAAPVLAAARFDVGGEEPVRYRGRGRRHPRPLFSPYLNSRAERASRPRRALSPPWHLGIHSARGRVRGGVCRAAHLSLASLAAAVTLPLAVYASARAGLSPSHATVLGGSVLVMLVVIGKHRGNIRRLLAGTEPRLARRKDA